MNWVLFNGQEFWISPGLRTRDPDAATRIPEEDALAWVRGTRAYDDGGFYPVITDIGGWLITTGCEEYL